MDWKTAQEKTLDTWRGIRAAVDRKDELELLTEINAVCGLCEKAEKNAGEDLSVCRYCLHYQQFGGCREVSGLMSVAVVERDWDRLRALADELLTQVKSLELES